MSDLVTGTGGSVVCCCFLSVFRIECDQCQDTPFKKVTGHFVMLKQVYKIAYTSYCVTVTPLSFVQNKLICQNLFLGVKRVKYLISFLAEIQTSSFFLAATT